MRTILAALALAAVAGAAQTHVVGLLAAAGDYTPPTGYVILSWQTFTAGDNTVYPAHTTRLEIQKGKFDAWLEPGSYLLAWGNIGNPELRTLTVPASTTPVALAACITTTPTEPLAQFSLQQLSPSGATVGQVIAYTSTGWAPSTVAGAGAIPISGVVGLQTALDLKATAIALAAETAARQADTTAATAALAGETSARAAAIASEAGTRAAADTANAAAIASEATARGTAVTDEATARGAAIASEASARAAADAAMATYTEAFTNALTVTIPAALHHFQTADLSVSCRDTAGKAYEVDYSINPSTFEIVIMHAQTQTGFCTVRR